MADYTFDAAVHGTLGHNVTSELVGLDDMSLTLAGGTTTTLAGENTVHSDATVEVKPLTTTSDITLGPVTTASDVRLELAPIQTHSAIDLEPVAVDSCLRIELGPLPATDVHSPYEQRWSWAVLGTELFSLSVCGHSSTHLAPGGRRPHVID